MLPSLSASAGGRKQELRGQGALGGRGPGKLLAAGLVVAALAGSSYLGPSEAHRSKTETSAVHLALQGMRLTGKRAHTFCYLFPCLGRKNI